MPARSAAAEGLRLSGEAAPPGEMPGAGEAEWVLMPAVAGVAGAWKYALRAAVGQGRVFG